MYLSCIQGATFDVPKSEILSQASKKNNSKNLYIPNYEPRLK